MALGLPLCGIRKMRRTPADLPAPARAQAVRCGEGVPCGNKPHALKECSACRDHGATPSRDNCLFLSALARKTFHHFCCADCRSRNCFSTDLTSSVLGLAPTPVSAPFAFSAYDDDEKKRRSGRSLQRKASP